MFANLLVVGELKNEVAKRAGLAPNKLLGATDASRPPGSAGTADPGKATPTTPRLHTSVLLSSDQVQLPIIKIDAQAPSPVLAARITSAATATLSLRHEEGGVRRRQCDQAAEHPQPGRSGGGSGDSRAPAPAGAARRLLVFVLGCTAIVMVPAFMRAWRLSEDDEEQDQTRDPDEAEAEAEAEAEVEDEAAKPMAAASGRR